MTRLSSMEITTKMMLERPSYYHHVLQQLHQTTSPVVDVCVLGPRVVRIVAFLPQSDGASLPLLTRLSPAGPLCAVPRNLLASDPLLRISPSPLTLARRLSSIRIVENRGSTYSRRGWSVWSLPGRRGSSRFVADLDSSHGIFSHPFTPVSRRPGLDRRACFPPDYASPLSLASDPPLTSGRGAILARRSFLTFPSSHLPKSLYRGQRFESRISSSNAAFYVVERSKRDVLGRRPNDSFSSRSD